MLHTIPPDTAGPRGEGLRWQNSPASGSDPMNSVVLEDAE